MDGRYAPADVWNGFQRLDINRRFLSDESKELTGIFDQTSMMYNKNSNYSLKLGADYYLSAKTTLGIVLNGGLSPEDQQHFARLNAAFAWALNDELRKKDSKNLQRLLSPAEMDAIEKKHFKPVAILDLMANWLAVKHREGLIDSMQLSATDKRLSVMSEIVGGCERILNTPLPFAYHVLLHRVVYIYCFLLPFGLLEVLHWMMPFLVMFISYTFISLDAIVDDIGEPFGEAANDLALNSICRTIEYSVFEQTGVAQAPLQQPTSHFID